MAGDSLSIASSSVRATTPVPAFRGIHGYHRHVPLHAPRVFIHFLDGFGALPFLRRLASRQRLMTIRVIQVAKLESP
jgi:hypothetical protein